LCPGQDSRDGRSALWWSAGEDQAEVLGRLDDALRAEVVAFARKYGVPLAKDSIDMETNSGEI
jgi:hypothetical protein